MDSCSFAGLRFPESFQCPSECSPQLTHSLISRSPGRRTTLAMCTTHGKWYERLCACWKLEAQIPVVDSEYPVVEISEISTFERREAEYLAAKG